MKLRTKAIIATMATGLLVAGVSLPASAATINLPARTCGTTAAKHVYIQSTGYGSIKHEHYNNATNTYFISTFNDATLATRDSTQGFTAELAPKIVGGTTAVINAYSDYCDNP